MSKKSSSPSKFHSVYINTLALSLSGHFFLLSKFHSVYINTLSGIAKRFGMKSQNSILFILIRRFPIILYINFKTQNSILFILIPKTAIFAETGGWSQNSILFILIQIFEFKLCFFLNLKIPFCLY